MSAKKFSNFDQRRQTLMPRPPYRGYDLSLGFVQRCRMASQVLNSGVFDIPWVVLAFHTAGKTRSRHKHPHDSIRSPRTWSSRASYTVPQSQRNLHPTRPLMLGARSTATRRVNRVPGLTGV